MHYILNIYFKCHSSDRINLVYTWWDVPMECFKLPYFYLFFGMKETHGLVFSRVNLYNSGFSFQFFQKWQILKHNMCMISSSINTFFLKNDVSPIWRNIFCKYKKKGESKKNLRCKWDLNSEFFCFVCEIQRYYAQYFFFMSTR